MRFEAAAQSLGPRPRGLGRVPVGAGSRGPTQQAPSLNPPPAPDAGLDVSRGNSRGSKVKGGLGCVRGVGGSYSGPAMGAAGPQRCGRVTPEVTGGGASGPRRVGSPGTEKGARQRGLRRPGSAWAAEPRWAGCGDPRGAAPAGAVGVPARQRPKFLGPARPTCTVSPW